MKTYASFQFSIFEFEMSSMGCNPAGSELTAIIDPASSMTRAVSLDGPKVKFRVNENRIYME